MPTCPRQHLLELHVGRTHQGAELRHVRTGDLYAGLLHVGEVRRLLLLDLRTRLVPRPASFLDHDRSLLRRESVHAFGLAAKTIVA